MAHTPGPWNVDLETGEIEAQNATLGTIYGASDYPCCEEDIDEECKANARLIAAAPELLEACKNLITVHDATSTTEFINGLPVFLYPIRAAIAKAEGK